MYSNYSILRLRTTLPEWFASVSAELVETFFKRVKQLGAAYCGKEVDENVSKSV